MNRAEKRRDRLGQAVSEIFGTGKAAENSEDSLIESGGTAEAEKPPAEAKAQPVEAANPPAPPKAQPAAPAFADDDAPTRRENCTYFAAGTSIEGVLRSDSDVEIVGDFSGEIMAEGKVTIHANTVSSIAAKGLALIGSTLTGGVTVDGDVTLDGGSSITGNVRARGVDSAGAIRGNLAARDSVALRGRASVTGDIKTALLSVERGVKINGKVDMAQ